MENHIPLYSKTNMVAFIINKNITLEELDYMIYTVPSSSSVYLYKLHNIHYDL